MGRLKKDNTLKSFLLPAVAAGAIFLVARPALAQLIEIPTEASVKVGVDVVDGYSQIFYVQGANKVFVTQGSQNSRYPDSDGEYIVWSTDMNGVGQIFRYHIPTEQTIELPGALNNLEPKVSIDGKVVWEGWVVPAGVTDGNWQIILFDGVSVAQITSGEISINPDIEGDYVVFSRKNIEGMWRTEGYSITDRKSATVSIGLESKFPELRGEEVVLAPPGGEEKVEPLKISDILLIEDREKTPMATVTTEEIREELEKDLSALESQ